ncbi:hypothetical protein ACVSQB_08125 [Bradyrhizobium elkanii]
MLGFLGGTETCAAGVFKLRMSNAYLTQIKDTPADKSRLAGAVPANDAASLKRIYAIEEIAARSGGQRLLSMMSGAT